MIINNPPGIIRPPIRNAYNTEEEYNIAVKIGIEYAINNGITYIQS